MTTESQLPYFKDPGFIDAIHEIQEERWSEGLSKLDALLEKYPFEPEIRAFRHQVVVKSHIDQYETEEIEAARHKQLRRRFTQLGVLIVFLVAIILGSTVYADIIRGQVDRQVEIISENFGDIELSIKFRSGQNLLQAGRAEEALAIFEEIYAENPDFENIDMFIAEAKGVLSLEGQYQNALVLLSQNNWEDALEILQIIQAEDSTYKDVPILIERSERYINLGDLLEEANLAYDAANWSVAVVRFEAIRLADSAFETEIVEERLFNSYVNAASAVLEDPEAEAEELATAEEYFTRALSMRPQDEDVYRIRKRVQDTIRGRLVDRYISLAQSALVNQEDSVSALEVASLYLNKARELDPANSQIALQSELANRYLSALNSFRSLLWTSVITDLEYVYSFDTEYASGTARQTLYDSYIIRGDTRLASGDFELALDDFRRAIELAGEMGETGVLSVYEGQLKIAFTLGLVFDYEGAVLMYQNAVNTGDLRNRLATTEPGFVASIDAANQLAQSSSFRLSYIRYRDAFEQNELLYSEFVTHVVREGEYLSQIARIYQSSIQAIVKANSITDPNRIVAGDELIIPILLEQQ